VEVGKKINTDYEVDFFINILTIARIITARIIIQIKIKTEAAIQFFFSLKGSFSALILDSSMICLGISLIESAINAGRIKNHPDNLSRE